MRPPAALRARPVSTTGWLVPLMLPLLAVWACQGCAGDGGTGGQAGAGAAGTTGAAGTGSAGSSGTVGTAGRGGAGGRGGTGGTTGVAGASARGGTGGASTAASLCTWPTATGSQSVSETIMVSSGTYDGGMKRFTGSGALGSAGQAEDQGPLFLLENGTTLQNVILGAPAADGVHCEGTCTLRNVWWEDVGEDAATLKGDSASQTMTIENGGATKATDKVFQHNGPGTMIVRNFCVQDFGKLYRSCGNCLSQFERHVQFQNIMVIPRTNSSLAGMNSNYNDTATFSQITIRARANSIGICERYTGNSTGAEPTQTGSGADGTVCIYAASDITWAP